MDGEVMNAWIEVRNAISELKSKAKWLVDRQHKEAIEKATDEYKEKLNSIFQDLI